jgi:hypothetical protein
MAAVHASHAQARPDIPGNAPSKQAGSWSAATRNGLTVMGTWTAVLDTNGTVTGTWALVDAQGTTRADGAWSAAKSPNGWTGAWRAVISGRAGELAGTWTAAVDRKPAGRLADLFEKAVEAIVSGTWRVGAGQSGAWSIRTFK